MSEAARRLPVFQKFIDDLRDIWAHEPDMGRRMEKAKPFLAALLRDEDLKARSAHWPSTEGRQNLRFYVDEDYGFVINGVVRMPGRTGSVHDHGIVWVLYGVLDGAESLERYKRVDDGSTPSYAKVAMTSLTTGAQGKVDLVAPHEIHAEQGGPTRSVAIIVRSQRTGEGTVLQKGFDKETGEITERYGPKQVPFELNA